MQKIERDLEALCQLASRLFKSSGRPLSSPQLSLIGERSGYAHESLHCIPNSISAWRQEADASETYFVPVSSLPSGGSVNRLDTLTLRTLQGMFLSQQADIPFHSNSSWLTCVKETQ
ncbi:hypothetical protein TNCV_2312511 [Trichonephila clavipes]|nr:hypothetical protein TNCV_2312511 [Trichonephila clavipes]